MLITRKSVFSGKEHTKDLPITDEQWAAYNSGTVIQKALPHLSADDREFILTGSTPEEWDEMFGEDEEDK